jgi:hypothetical protein
MICIYIYIYLYVMCIYIYIYDMYIYIYIYIYLYVMCIYIYIYLGEGSLRRRQRANTAGPITGETLGGGHWQQQMLLTLAQAFAGQGTIVHGSFNPYFVLMPFWLVCMEVYRV